MSFSLMDATIDIRVDTSKVKAELAALQADTDKVLNRMEVRNFNRGKTMFARQNNLRLATNRMAIRQARMREREMNEHNRLLDARHSKQMRTMSTLRQIGMVATVTGAAILASITFAVKGYADFEVAMRKATAVSDVSSRQFQVMSNMAENMSVKLNIAATDAASAFYFLGSAGLTVKEQLETFNATITLSKAATISAGQAAEIMVDTLRGFKLETSEAEHVTDVLAHSVISSNMTFLQLGETLSLVAGVARSTNNSLEETTAAIQLMANVGIKGTRAGTTLRRSLLNLAAPSSKIKRLFRNMNIEISDQSGKIKPYITLVGEISDALRGASQEQQQMAFRTLFGARAIAGQLEVFTAGKEKLLQMVAESTAATGTSQRIAMKQMAAFGNRLGILDKRTKKLARSWGELMAPSIDLVTGMLDDLVKKFEEAANRGSLFFAAMGNAAAVVGITLTAVGSLATVLSSLSLFILTTTLTWSSLLAVIAPVALIFVAIAITIGVVVAEIARLKRSQGLLAIDIEETTKQVNKQIEALEKQKEAFKATIKGTKILSQLERARAMISKTTLRQQTLLEALEMKGPKGLIQKMVVARELLEKMVGATKAEAIASTLPFVLGGTISDLQKLLELEMERNQAILDGITLRADELKRNQIRRTGTEAEKLAIGFEALRDPGSLRTITGWFDELQETNERYTLIHTKLVERRISNTREEIDEINLLGVRTVEVNKFLDKLQEAVKARRVEIIRHNAALQSEDFIAGFKSQATEFEQEIPKLGQVGADAAVVFRDGFSDALFDIGMRTKSLQEIFNDFFISINQSLMRMASDIIANAIAMRLFGEAAKLATSGGGGGGTTGGGIVGGIASLATKAAIAFIGGGIDTTTPGTPNFIGPPAPTFIGPPAPTGVSFPTILPGPSFPAPGVIRDIRIPNTIQGIDAVGRIPSTSELESFLRPHTGGLIGFSNIPRFHKGLAADEFPAILQAGETVIPKNKSRSFSGTGGKTNITINIQALDSKDVFASIEPLKKELAMLLQDAGSLNVPARRG